MQSLSVKHKISPSLFLIPRLRASDGKVRESKWMRRTDGKSRATIRGVSSEELSTTITSAPQAAACDVTALRHAEIVAWALYAGIITEAVERDVLI
jgi:hypothetical protein